MRIIGKRVVFHDLTKLGGSKEAEVFSLSQALTLTIRFALKR